MIGAPLDWTRIQKFSWSGSDERAPTVIMGVPLDETTSFRPGARFGPAAAREASLALEDYSLRQRRLVEPSRYYDAGDLVLPMGNVEEALEVIRRAADAIMGEGRRFLALGGEHLITLPLVESVLLRFPDLAVIHLDAHADLRSEFTGTRYSHGTVMRRVAELLGPGRVYQLGIRSADKSELDETRGLTEIHFYKVLEPLRTVVSKLDSRPVYLTIDVDVVDPAFAPGTGVPEPGGITSQELLDAVAALQGVNVVAADLVEVAPAYDSTGQTGLLAASIVRECLLLLSRDRDRAEGK